MRSKLILFGLLFIMSSCMKGLIFDKEMVIGDWQMWEVYSPGYIYYWTFTDDYVYIYKAIDSTFKGGPTVGDQAVATDTRELVYQQAGWNNRTFNLNLFEQSNPFDSSKNFGCHIEISKNRRDYLVLEADNYNWSATLSRIKR